MTVHYLVFETIRMGVDAHKIRREKTPDKATLEWTWRLLLVWVLTLANDGRYALNTLVLFLRTAVAGCAGGLVWLLVGDAMGAGQSMLHAIAPVWLGGILGGVVSALFSPRQGIAIAFTTGVIMAAMFLVFRHVYLGLPLGTNTALTLWPMWFPVAYYAGAYGYLTVLQKIYRS